MQARPTAQRRRRRPEQVPAGADAAGAPVDMGDLPHSIGYALRRAQLAVFEDFIASLATLDLRPAQYSVLLIIERNPGLKQSQVSAALGIQRTNFVAMIDELEQRGLARRAPVPNDRRSYALELTPAGRNCVREARRLQARHEERLAAVLGPDGREKLLALLQALTAQASDRVTPAD